MRKCAFLCFFFAFAQHFIRCKAQFFRVKKGIDAYEGDAEKGSAVFDLVCGGIVPQKRYAIEIDVNEYVYQTVAVLPTANPTPLYFSPKILYTEINHNRCKGELT